MTNQLWWYVARSSGLLAWGLLSASVLWGLAITTRVFSNMVRQAWLLDLHRFLGAGALALTGIHMVSLVLDNYVHFGLVEILVPLTGSWHPVAVGWGIAGFYLLLALELTSLVRARLPQKLWRRVHYLSFPLFVVSTVHGLTAGTDSSSGAFRLTTVAVCLAVAGLVAVRVSSIEEPTAPVRRTA